MFLKVIFGVVDYVWKGSETIVWLDLFKIC